MPNAQNVTQDSLILCQLRYLTDLLEDHSILDLELNYLFILLSPLHQGVLCRSVPCKITYIANIFFNFILNYYYTTPELWKKHVQM